MASAKIWDPIRHRYRDIISGEHRLALNSGSTALGAPAGYLGQLISRIRGRASRKSRGPRGAFLPIKPNRPAGASHTDLSTKRLTNYIMHFASTSSMWDDLPAEMKYTVVEHLDDQDIPKFSKLNRETYGMAVPSLYKVCGSPP